MPLSINPDFEEFSHLAGQTRVVTVSARILADQVTPVSVFERLVGDQGGFLLESVDHHGRWSRWSFVGVRAAATLSAIGRQCTFTVSDWLPAASQQLLRAIDINPSGGALGACETVLDALARTGGNDLPPLQAGLVGYFGYDVVREVEHLPDMPDDDAGFEDARQDLLGDVVAIDHWSQHAIVMANVFVPEEASGETLAELYQDAQHRIEAMVSAGAIPLDEPLVQPPVRDGDPVEVESSMQGTYEAAVEAAKEHIRAGDIFQVVLAQRFSFSTSADPFDIYRALRQINPSPYMYFLRYDALTVVGCSPEPMVQLLEGKVISRPIAGTRFRGLNDEHDRRLAAELLEHPKERAEHVMLVDLARNDLGRVVEFGTCVVDEMMNLERYSHVMHLTSQVSGTLRPEFGAIDVLRATLPAGTVSGAPKVRAMEIIDDLEPTKRGPYAGTIGYLDVSGSIDTAIAIRTMLVATQCDATGRRRASVQAGAGVVADSVPGDEELETRNKAKALLSAVRPAEAMTAARAVARARG